MTADYQLATIAAISALAIVLGVVALKELDYRLRRLEIGRRNRRRKGRLL